MTAPVPVTVGLPVYNREKFVGASLESLLSQTFTDFEVVICDNASTDGTGDICRDYAARDRRIRYYRNPENVGANPNFNRVFELSRGKYLKWSTSDDRWEPDMIEKTYPIMEANPDVVLCYPKTIIVDGEDNVLGEYEDNLHLMDDNPATRFIHLIERIGLCHQHLGLIRRDQLARTALLLNHIASDLNLLAELSLYGKFYEYPERLFYRRMHPESSSWKKGPSTDAVEHQLDFTDPQRRLGIRNHLLHRHRAFLRAIHRAPLTAHDRRRLDLYVLRGIYWNRGFIIREFVEGLRDRFRR